MMKKTKYIVEITLKKNGFLNNNYLTEKHIIFFIKYGEWLINKPHDKKNGERTEYNYSDYFPQDDLLLKTFIKNYYIFESIEFKKSVITFFEYIKKMYYHKEIWQFIESFKEVFKCKKITIYELSNNMKNLKKPILNEKIVKPLTILNFLNQKQIT